MTTWGTVKLTVAVIVIPSATHSSSTSSPAAVTGSLTALGTYLKTFDVLGASGILLVFALIFSIAAYLNIRRMQQN